MMVQPAGVSVRNCSVRVEANRVDEREQRYSLFDLTTDPGETIDIAASRVDLVDELAKRLRAWRTLQIDYYADTKLQKIEYPPILSD